MPFGSIAVVLKGDCLINIVQVWLNGYSGIYLRRTSSKPSWITGLSQLVGRLKALVYGRGNNESCDHVDALHCEL